MCIPERGWSLKACPGAMTIPRLPWRGRVRMRRGKTSKEVQLAGMASSWDEPGDGKWESGWNKPEEFSCFQWVQILLGQGLASCSSHPAQRLLLWVFYWNTPRPFITRSSGTELVLQGQSWVAVTESLGLAKPKMFTFWLFTGSLSTSALEHLSFPLLIIFLSLALFVLGKSHGQRGLAGHSPWGHKRVRHDLATKQQLWIWSVS